MKKLEYQASLDYSSVLDGLNEIKKAFDKTGKTVVIDLDASQYTKEVDEVNSKKIKQEVDTSMIEEGYGEIREFARDTGVELDREHQIKMLVDIEEVKARIENLKLALKDPAFADRKIEIAVQATHAKEELTEMKRQFKNYQNTGEEGLSRLQAKFNSVNATTRSFGSQLVQAFSGGFSGVLKLVAAIPLIGPVVSIAIGFLKTLRGAITSCVSTAMEFEDAFVGVRKTVNGTESDLQKIENGLIKLSKTIPLSVKELGKIAELGGQLGVPTADILDFTKTIAMIGVTTNLTEEQAATSFARISNILNEPIKNVDKMASVVVELGNNFATSESEIVDFTSRLASAGAIAGLTTAQIIAISTAFSSVNQSAEAGGRSVREVMLNITQAVTTNSKQLERFAVVSGKTASEFAKLFKEDASKAFDLFVHGLKNSGDDAIGILQELKLKNSNTINALLSLANNADILTQALDMANKARDENNALQIEADKRFNSTSSQIQIQQNRRAAFGASFGQVFNAIWVPVFKGITSFFIDILPVLFDNVGVFMDNVVITFINGINYIIDALMNIPGGLAMATNEGLSILSDFLNWTGEKVNRLITQIKKIPGMSDVVGDFKFGTVNFAPVKEPEVNRGKYTQEFKKFRSISDEIDTSISAASENIMNKIKGEIVDESLALEKLQDITDKTSKGTEDMLKKRKEELKELRDEEIRAIQESTMSQEEKYQEILKISEEYDKEIIELEGKTQDELIKEAEEAEKKRLKDLEDAAKKEVKATQDKYKDITKEIDKFQDKVKDLEEDIKDWGEKNQERLGEMTNDIRDLNREIADEESERAIDRAERYVEIKKELDKPTDKNTDGEERNKLQREFEYLTKNTTEELRKQAEEYDKLTDSEKDDLKHQEKINALIEQRNISQALVNTAETGGNGIRYTDEDDGSMRGFYLDEKGEEKEVVDYKNLQYLIGLKNKQTAMEQELVDIKNSLAAEYELYAKYDEDRAKMEQDFTEELAEQIEERKENMTDEVDHYRKEAERKVDIAQTTAQQLEEAAVRILAAQARIADSTSGGGNTTNNNTTVNQTINNASDMSFYNSLKKSITQT